MIDFISWDNTVSIWWTFLVCASVLNILFWIWTRVYAYRKVSVLRLQNLWRDKSNIIWFSGIYVFVCAFRSFLPRADVQRICLFDTWLSSVLVGRTVATFGELAFVIQWMMVLGFMAKQTQSISVSRIAKVIVPTIAIAECFSWYAVITTHYLGNAIEESLWGITYTLIAVALVILQSHLRGALRLAVRFALIGCVAYVAFMFTVDVPMYVGRWILDQSTGKPLLGLIDGLRDLNTRWHVTWNISDWQSEIPWQTLYFTFAVLVSIALCYVPHTQDRLERFLKR